MIMCVLLRRGACSWAFSATGSIEGAHAIKSKKLVSLSEQQLVDCDMPPDGLAGKCCGVSNPKGCDCGCKGGIMSRAFRYVMAAGGLATEAAYNYTGQGGTCKKSVPAAATISGQVNLSVGDLGGLTAAVATQGPVSVAIDVNFCWQFYQKGSIFYGNTTGADGKDYCSNDGSPCSSKPVDLDHGVSPLFLIHLAYDNVHRLSVGLTAGVLVVGYGQATPPGGKEWDVWYVKNSWGPGYGDDGFMLYAPVARTLSL